MSPAALAPPIVIRRRRTRSGSRTSPAFARRRHSYSASLGFSAVVPRVRARELFKASPIHSCVTSEGSAWALCSNTGECGEAHTGTFIQKNHLSNTGLVQLVKLTNLANGRFGNALKLLLLGGIVIPRDLFYSTNRTYSASLTRLHMPPTSGTPMSY